MNRAPFSEALAEALEAGLAGMGDGAQDIAVGRDRPPRRGDLPYVILYSLEGGGWLGPPVSLEADAALLYQVKVVAKRSGSNPDQPDVLGGETLGDTVRAIMLAAGDGVAGITVMRRYSAAVGGSQADDKVMNHDERFWYLVTTS